MGKELKLPSVPTSDELDRLCVVLVATRNPLNIGAVARAMSNFGFRHLRVVNPYDVAFQEARSAVGAADLLANAQEYASLAAAIADCTLVVGTTAIGHRQMQHPLRLLGDAAPLIRGELSGEINRTRRVALVFGSEKFGLSNESLSHCHWILHIPTDDENFSMNLGQAVAVCLYELVRDSKAAPEMKPPQPASGEELERMTTSLLAALHASGYLHSHPADVAEEQVRRLILRLNLSSPDVEILLGMLRKILWKMGADAKPASF